MCINCEQILGCFIPYLFSSVAENRASLDFGRTYNYFYTMEVYACLQQIQISQSKTPKLSLAKMKAVRVVNFGGPEVLEVKEIDIPSVGEDEVLVKVYAAGVNPVETYIRNGAYSKLPQLPFTPGKIKRYLFTQ